MGSGSFLLRSSWNRWGIRAGLQLVMWNTFTSSREEKSEFIGARKKERSQPLFKNLLNECEPRFSAFT